MIKRLAEAAIAAAFLIAVSAVFYCLDLLPPPERDDGPEVLCVADFIKASSVDINTADADRLEELDGIGEVLAARIVEYREQNGPFTSVDELTKVKGIGPVKLRDNLPRIYVDTTASDR